MIISFFITERWTEREVMYVSYVGKLFLRMLKALILPLIVPSLVAAVGSLDMSISGKVNNTSYLWRCFYRIYRDYREVSISQLWISFFPQTELGRRAFCCQQFRNIQCYDAGMGYYIEILKKQFHKTFPPTVTPIILSLATRQIFQFHIELFVKILILLLGKLLTFLKF